MNRSKKKLELKSKKCKFGGSLISFNSANFVGDKRPPVEPRKKFGTHQKYPKIHIISRSSLFLAILESLDPPKKLFLASLTSSLPPQKVLIISVEKYAQEKYFCKVSNLEPILHCMLNAQKQDCIFLREAISNSCVPDIQQTIITIIAPVEANKSSLQRVTPQFCHPTQPPHLNTEPRNKQYISY